MDKAWRYIGIIIIIGLAIWLIYHLNFVEIYNLIKKADPLFLILAIIAMGSSFIVWNIRWIPIFKGHIRRPKFWFFLKVVLAGEFFNTITPGMGVGGEPFKAHLIAKKYKKPQSKIFGLVMADTFYKLIAWGTFIIFSASFVLIYIQIPTSLKLVLEAILLFIILIAILSILILLNKINFKIGNLFKALHKLNCIKKRFKKSKDLSNYINSKIKMLLNIFRKVIKKKKNAWLGIPLSFAFWILQFLCSYFLFLAFGYNINFLSVIVVFTLGIIIGSLSPLPGGIGTIEGATTLLYSAIGIIPSLAVLVAFASRIVYYLFSLLIGGLALLLLKGKSREKILPPRNPKKQDIKT